MNGLQGTFVLIIAAAAFLAGITGERRCAELARQAVAEEALEER